MHVTPAPARPQFRLITAPARAFLAEAILRWKKDNITGPRPGGPGDGWDLQPGWNPHQLDLGEEGHVENLVSGAIDAGAVTCPPGLKLRLIIQPGDCGDWMYDWRVDFTDPLSDFSLCLPHRYEYRRLGTEAPGEPRSAGARKAWRILSDAVTEGNRILDAYTRACGRIPSGNDMSREL